MSSGLIALLDDIAAITKFTAASLDDVAAAAGKAGTKAMGVVIDDAAVTPRYVTDFQPQRELPIIWRIAKGSLFNKLILILPVALLLSTFAPWAITPLLMVGGAYLCFEGAEKLIHAFSGDHAEDEDNPLDDSPEAEEVKIKGAIRTDFILSAEIMAIALATVSDQPLAMRAAALAAAGIGVTILVYGVVALIVKMDDVGLHLAGKKSSALQRIGRGLVKGMPIVMSALSKIGTAAMLWVGGQIFVHGMEELGMPEPGHTIKAIATSVGQALSAIEGVATWVVTAALDGVFGLILGSIIVLLIGQIQKLRGKAH